MYDSGVDPDGQVPPPGWEQGPGDFQDFQAFTQGFTDFSFDDILRAMTGSFKQERTGGRQRDVQRNYNITIGNKTTSSYSIEGELYGGYKWNYKECKI